MSTVSQADRGRRRWQALGAVLAVLALNVGAYAVLATEPAQDAVRGIDDWAYLGTFVLALVTNAGVLIPVPYNAIVLQLVAVVQYPLLVAVLAATGSALGESTGWWVGSKGRAVLPTGGRVGRVVATLQRFTRRRRTAFVGLAVFAAVPNYAFDVAGLIAGASKVAYPLFLVAVLSGRLVRFGLMAAFGAALLELWPF